MPMKVYEGQYNYDRLQNVKGRDGEEWNHKCIYCNSERLIIHATDIVYQPHTINEYKDLPKEVQNYFYHLPNIVEAIMLLIKNNREDQIMIECIDCKTHVRNFWNERPDSSGKNYAIPNKQKVKRYIEKLYGMSEAMRLDRV